MDRRDNDPVPKNGNGEDPGSTEALNQQWQARLEAVERRLRQAQQLAELSQRDRKLIAYEIHDGMLQDITAAAMFLDVACAQLPPDAEDARQNIHQALTLIRSAMAEARRLIGGIQLPVLEAAGLAAALEALLDEHRRRGRITMEASIDVHSERLVPTIETAAFRSLQEALTNAERYSQASRVRVRVTEHDDCLELEIEDDGVGFDRTRVPPDRFGLRGITERAELVGGRAEIDSAVGRGTRIHVTLPLADHMLTGSDKPPAS